MDLSKYFKRILLLKVLFSLWILFCKAFHAFCRVARPQYLNTEEFIDAVTETLKERMSIKAKL